MIIEIFKQLKQLNSIKDKESLLRVNKSNKQLLELLKAGLDPKRLFQFNKMPCRYSEDNKYTADGSKSLSFTSCYNMFMALLSKLENREISGNEAKQEVSDVFTAFDKDTFDLFSKILRKKSLGVSAKTVNKVWPGAIEEFNLMLGPNELPDVTKLDYPLFIQPKLDGYRCIYKEGELITRHGKKFKNKQLKNYFKCLDKASNYVLDGELYIKGKALNEHTKILNSLDAKLPSNLKYYVFDAIPLQNWAKEDYDKQYKARIKDVRAITNELIATPSKVIDMHTEEVCDASEAINFFKKSLTLGQEGAILRSKESIYKWKRTTVKSGELIKLKPKETVDVKIMEIFDGKDEFEGMAGGIIGISPDGTSCRVGSGFTIPDRQDMAKFKDKYIGKTLEITVMGKSKNSYRDPRAKRFRPDK